MLRTTLLLFLISSAASAQSVYDFESLTGSDTYPYSPLNGQDGWSEETFNAPNTMGVTATLSFDGTKALRFQEVGPGYGSDASRINDAAWSYAPYSGVEANAYFQVDMLVGFWGGSFGPAHDTNGNGQIRGAETGERGIRFVLGTQSNTQLRLVAADGIVTQSPLSSTGITGGDWVRVRVVMDLGANGGAGLGSVQYMNLTAGQTTFTSLAALQSVPLALSTTAMDASNPTLWDAMWLHLEGATYGIDNVEFGVLTPGVNYCMANANSTGAATTMSASGSASVSANDLVLEASGMPLNSFSFFITSQMQGFIQNPNGSQGNLCVSGAIGRYVGTGQIQNSMGTGTVALAIDNSITPQPTGLVQIVAGETWNFQLWHRDFVGGATSNFSDGLEITFSL